MGGRFGLIVAPKTEFRSCPGPCGCADPTGVLVLLSTGHKAEWRSV